MVDPVLLLLLGLVVIRMVVLLLVILLIRVLRLLILVLLEVRLLILVMLLLQVVIVGTNYLHPISLFYSHLTGQEFVPYLTNGNREA